MTVDVSKMGVGKNAWKQIHLNTLLKEGNIGVCFFFLLGEKKTTFLKPITSFDNLCNEQNIQAKSIWYLCELSVRLGD